MSELWVDLHKRALSFTGYNDAPFLREWSTRIPEYAADGKGCKCKHFWRRWVRFNHPVYHPSEKYFEWTVRAHNAVNEKLGKPLLSVEEARNLYTEK